VIIIFTKLLFGNFLIVKENLKSKEFTTKEMAQSTIIV